VRLYLVSHPYKRDWDFNWQGLARASRLVERLRSLLAGDAKLPKTSRAAAPGRALIAEFEAAMSDDLDTPRAVRALRAALRQRDAPAAKWMLDILAGSAALS
jgi:cysteinyl-tRNA synthetase